MEGEKNIKETLIGFAEWFNENQWRGGKGDYLKSLFCNCEYEKIVEHYFKKYQDIA